MAEIVPVKQNVRVHIAVKADPIAVTGGTSSSGTTFAANLGGVGLYSHKASNTLYFKGLVAGSNIVLTPSATGVTISSTGGGSPTGGTPIALFTHYTGVTAPAQFVDKLLFNDYSGSTRLIAGTNISLTHSPTGITVSASGGLDPAVFQFYTGTTAPAQFVNKTLFNVYSGTTIPALLALKVDKTTFGTYTGTTVPGLLALKVDKTTFNTYTGTTAPAQFVNKTLFNAYSGATQPVVNAAVTGATNLGTGSGVWQDKSGRNLRFKSMKARGGLAVSGTTNDLTYYYTGSTGLPLNASIASLSSTTTIDATYAGKTIECTGTFTLTLPNSMTSGMQVTIVNIGTGVITIAASGTLQTLDSRNKLRFQWSAVTAYYRASNTWAAFGNLTD